jgi:tetratricopeptide (TPR) repeat protein
MIFRVMAAVLFLAGAAWAQPADDFTAQQEALLAEARAALAENPDNAEARIWAGRRLGYLGRYDEAMAEFSEGWARYPEDARFPRHLGHRLITVRRFGEAADVLQQAADLMAARPDEVEPDGMPNAAGVPTSTLKGNIFYHLALAHYLQGDYAEAATVWAQAAAVAENVDAAAASRYWLYLSRMRAGDRAGAAAALAPVTADWALIENHDYQRLSLCFKGAGDCAALEEEAMASEGVAAGTMLYGLGAKALIDGDKKKARAIFARITDNAAPTSFGYIAAETETK